MRCGQPATTDRIPRSRPRNRCFARSSGTSRVPVSHSTPRAEPGATPQILSAIGMGRRSASTRPKRCWNAARRAKVPRRDVPCRDGSKRCPSRAGSVDLVVCGLASDACRGSWPPSTRSSPECSVPVGGRHNRHAPDHELGRRRCGLPDLATNRSRHVQPAKIGAALRARTSCTTRGEYVDGDRRCRPAPSPPATSPVDESSVATVPEPSASFPRRDPPGLPRPALPVDLGSVKPAGARIVGAEASAAGSPFDQASYASASATSNAPAARGDRHRPCRCRPQARRRPPRPSSPRRALRRGTASTTRDVDSRSTPRRA